MSAPIKQEPRVVVLEVPQPEAMPQAQPIVLPVQQPVVQEQQIPPVQTQQEVFQPVPQQQEAVQPIPQQPEQQPPVIPQQQPAQEEKKGEEEKNLPAEAKYLKELYKNRPSVPSLVPDLSKVTEKIKKALEIKI
jgi:hypothetical protein